MRILKSLVLVRVMQVRGEFFAGLGHRVQSEAVRACLGKPQAGLFKQVCSTALLIRFEGKTKGLKMRLL